MRPIDADELVEIVNFTFSKPPFSRKTILDMIKMARTLDAVTDTHGKWEHLGGDTWRCSACGEIEHTEGSWEHPLKDREWKYCRTCGAKMYETQKKPCDDCQEFDCYGCEYSEREEK